MTFGLLSRLVNSARSSKSHVRRRRRAVSAIVSAIEGLHAANYRVDGGVDMLDVGAEAEDSAAQAEAAVDPGAAEHDLTLLLDVLKQPFVEIVDVPAVGQMAESDHRQV